MRSASKSVVLLRGLTRDARHWGEVPQRLGEQLPGARVECLDLPGNGTLSGEASPWRIADYVDACRRQADERRLAGPLHLVALSLGGMVALEWAHRYRDQVASCVLINTSLRPLAPLHWRLRPGAMPSLARAMASRDVEARERDILHVTSRRFAPSAEPGASIAREWAALQDEAPVSRTNAIRQLIAASRYSLAGEPRVPILLLASTHDQLVDVRCSRAAASRWGGLLHEHPSAGHDLPLDDPAWVIQQVIDWVSASPCKVEG